MNVLGQFLDSRDEAAEQLVRPADEVTVLWLNSGQRPEVRLVSFDAWVRQQLAARLDWTWAGSEKQKRIEQCRIVLERVVLGLWKRGWMLDGRRLARRLEELLDNVGKYQKTGKVLDFWTYFKASVERYVGANAEELQAEAMRAGSTMQQLLGPLGIQAKGKGPALPELVALRAEEIAGAKQNLREKVAAVRAARKKGPKEPLLFDV